MDFEIRSIAFSSTWLSSFYRCNQIISNKKVFRLPTFQPDLGGVGEEVGSPCMVRFQLSLNMCMWEWGGDPIWWGEAGQGWVQFPKWQSLNSLIWGTPGRQTDTTENIAFPQFHWWAVKTWKVLHYTNSLKSYNLWIDLFAQKYIG